VGLEVDSDGVHQIVQRVQPAAAAAYRVNELVTVRGAVYHGFRAPTLNEFYRNFSAGNTLTRANEALDPERMTGGDLGVLVGNGRASARITASGTVSITPSPRSRCRARRHRLFVSAPTRIGCRRNGLELEGNVRVMDGVSLDASSAITSVHFTGNTSLNGNRVPQVPSYNAPPASATDGSRGPPPHSFA
jgi:outer membrane receptor protein involved in Fe transport